MIIGQLWQLMITL